MVNKVNKSANNMMLQELLEQAYGKKNVKVVKWKWTDEQLNQLKKQDKKRNELDLRKKMRKYNRLIDKFNRKNDEDKRQDILDQIDWHPPWNF